MLQPTLLCLFTGLLGAMVSTAMAQVMIVPGTAIVVRTIDSVESDTADAGRTFRASLDEPLVVQGNAVAPKGADVLLKIVEASQAGKLKGKAVLTVAIAGVKVDSAMVPIDTETVSVDSGGKGKSSAKKAFGGAALGGAIGALAGGAKGAAIGAGAGAAAGTAVAMATGPSVKIPSETRLTFKSR